ncbi:DUF6262 family protein [Streptomyces sp. NPDC002671]
MRADNSPHVIAAARQRAAATRARAIVAMRRMDTAGQPVTFDVVAREAGVSRSWLYTQPDLRAEIAGLRERHGPAPVAPRVARALGQQRIAAVTSSTERSGSGHRSAKTIDPC